MDVDVVDEIVDYLAAGLRMTAGTNIFNGELTKDAVDGLYLIELPGPEPDKYLDTETHIIEIMGRSNDTKEAKVLLRRAYDILQRKGNYQLVNWYIYFSNATGTIRDEDRDAEGGKLFSQTWQFICRNTNNIS